MNLDNNDIDLLSDEEILDLYEDFVDDKIELAADISYLSCYGASVSYSRDGYGVYWTTVYSYCTSSKGDTLYCKFKVVTDKAGSVISFLKGNSSNAVCVTEYRTSSGTSAAYCYNTSWSTSYTGIAGNSYCYK